MSQMKKINQSTKIISLCWYGVGNVVFLLPETMLMNTSHVNQWNNRFFSVRPGTDQPINYNKSDEENASFTGRVGSKRKSAERSWDRPGDSVRLCRYTYAPLFVRPILRRTRLFSILASSLHVFGSLGLYGILAQRRRTVHDITIQRYENKNCVFVHCTNKTNYPIRDTDGTLPSRKYRTVFCLSRETDRTGCPPFSIGRFQRPKSSLFSYNYQSRFNQKTKYTPFWCLPATDCLVRRNKKPAITSY